MKRWHPVAAALPLLLACAVAAAAGPGACAAPPLRTIVWQPWAAHAALDATGWERLGREVRRRGYSQVLLQWGRYGDYEFWPERDARWLAPGLQRWQAEGLKLILGLHMGEDYYRLLGEPDAVLAAHLADTRDKALAQARQILREQPALALEGWYLPQEIDDLHWRTPERQRLLQSFLAGMREALAELSPRTPVYASAFFSGATTPEEFARQLARLNQGTGVTWIVQDGLGTHRMTEARTRDYLAAIAQAMPAAAWRGLLEGFDERRGVDGQSASSFEASADTTLARRAELWCATTGRQAEVVFSLNQQMAAALPPP